MKNSCDIIIENLNVASMRENGQPYGHVSEATIAIRSGKIVYANKSDKCTFEADVTIDGKQQWALPGFIDCHTHLVYAGNRAGEFERRLSGESYESIARSGGGIASTVSATRDASETSLLASATERARCLFNEGVTCIEIKSGYGLDIETEAKMLRVAKQLETKLPIHVEPTYLGAHALPPEFVGDPQGYIDFICDQALPAIHARGLATAVDVFCESIGFSPDQCEQVYRKATELGLRIKGHVEQLSNLEGAVLAAHFNALSVDHIEYLNPNDVNWLRKSGTVAVLLPGAFYYLNEKQKPPVDALRKHNVPMAIATDANPGTSPITSLLTCANMASVLFGLTPEEAIMGITSHAARALNLASKGMIYEGADADFCLWDIEQPAQLIYEMNRYKPTAIWVGGDHVQ